MAKALVAQSSEELIAILERESEVRRENQRIARLGSAVLLVGLAALAGFLYFSSGTSVVEFLSSYYGAFLLIALGGVAVTARHR